MELTLCPFCRTHEVEEIDSYRAMDFEITTFKCSSCGQEWQEQYNCEPADYEDLMY